METLAVTPSDLGRRLDQLLATRFPGESRSYFQRLITQGLVLVNGSIVKKSAKLDVGDEVEVQFALSPELSVEPEAIPLDIVYEDEWLLAINKPAGLVVHPGVGNWTGTFVNALLHHCQTLPGDHLRPGIVHRLDKDTTGLLLAAKTERAHQGLVQAFAERKIEKEYLAVCCGSPKVAFVDAPLGRHPRDRKKQAVIEGGKEAYTALELISSQSPLTVVRARPRTGRTHQIRVHLAHIGCPILGDVVYGWSHWNTKHNATRQFLHALRIAFIHPITQSALQLTAPIPDDMRIALEALRMYNGVDARTDPTRPIQ